MAPRRATYIILLVGFVLLPACQPGRMPAKMQRSEAQTELQGFEGVIDNSGQTYDSALSDLYVRASRALEAGDAETAEQLYREAIAKYPKDADGYVSLGACLYFQKKYEEAKAEYLCALELAPKSVHAHYGLGCVAHKQKKYAESQDYL